MHGRSCMIVERGRSGDKSLENALFWDMTEKPQIRRRQSTLTLSVSEAHSSRCQGVSLSRAAEELAIALQCCEH